MPHPAALLLIPPGAFSGSGPFHYLVNNPATTTAARAGASTILAIVLARDLWLRTPLWVREDDLWRSLFLSSSSSSSGKEEGGKRANGDEMASLASVLQKLQALITTGYEKLGSQRRRARRRRRVAQITKAMAIMSPPAVRSLQEINMAPISALEWNASLLAYVQLCNQMRERHPHWRDGIYLRALGLARDRHNTGEPPQDAVARFTGSREDLQQDLGNHLPEAAENAGENRSTIGFHPNLDRSCQNYDSAHHGADSSTETASFTSLHEEQSKHCHEQQFSQPSQVKQQPSGLPEIDPKKQMDSYQSTIPLTTEEIKELRIMLNYAVWAYEPDEETLRSWLLSQNENNDQTNVSLDNFQKSSNNESDKSQNQSQTGGFQLLLHQTTSYITENDPNDNGSNTQRNKRSKSKNPQRKPPGRVGYYVAISPKKRTLLIGIKGTSTLEELLTDCCGRAVRVDLDHDPHYPSLGSCHSGSDEDVNHEEALDPSLHCAATAPVIDDCVLSVTHYRDNVICVENKRNHSSGDMVVEVVHDCQSFPYLPIHDEEEKEQIIEEETTLITTLMPPSNPLNHSQYPTAKFRTATRRHTVASSFTAPSPSENILLMPSSSVDTLCDTRETIPTKERNARVLLTPLSYSPQENIDCNSNTNSHDDDEILENGIEMEPLRSTKLRGAHEGILHCAQQLLYELSPIIEEYAVLKGYDVVCTGHSLGGGAAALLTLLIRAKYPMLVVPHNIDEHDNDIHNDGVSSKTLQEPSRPFPSSNICCPLLLSCGETITSGQYQQQEHQQQHRRQRQRVRAYTFASPPVLDRASSLACRHYVMSVVNNSDIIPRSSLTNLDVLLTVLEAVRTRLVEMDMNPGANQRRRGRRWSGSYDDDDANSINSSNSSSATTNRGRGWLFGRRNLDDSVLNGVYDNTKGNKESNNKNNATVISSILMLYRKLSEGTGGNLIMSPNELTRIWEEAVAEASLGDGKEDGYYWDEVGDHHLFVPGKLLMMYEPWSLLPSQMTTVSATSTTISASTDDDASGLNDDNGNSDKNVNSVKPSSNDTSSNTTNSDDIVQKPKTKLKDNVEQTTPSPSSSSLTPALETSTYHAMWTDGTSPILKGFEVGAGSAMATDHLTTSYYRALDSLQIRSEKERCY